MSDVKHREVERLKKLLESQPDYDSLTDEIKRLRGLLREWHDKDWKRTASLCLPKNHLVLRTRAALAGEKP